MNHHFTAALLTLPLQEAVEVLGAYGTTKHLPDSAFEALQDLADTALACFPEAEVAFWALMDAEGVGKAPTAFNYLADAYRLLVPAVRDAAYPIIARNGEMSVVIRSDTPLMMMLPRVQVEELSAALQAA